MREDGEHTYYQVEGYLDVCPGRFRWTVVDAGSILFRDLPYDTAAGHEGDRLRELLKPRDELWQQIGIHGYAVQDDALRVMQVLAITTPGRKYRTVEMHVTQRTSVVATLLAEEKTPEPGRIGEAPSTHMSYGGDATS